MNDRRNTDTPQGAALLPPCRVCGALGCGFHYGVTTCDACKGFFRRSLLRKEPYACMKSQLCHVGSSTNRRQSCRKCRYDKCVAVGMSKQACKIGRYSKVKKSNDMKDVMKHKQSLRDVEFVHRDTVIKTLHTGAFEQESSQKTTHFQASKKYSDKPNEFRITNEPYAPKPVSVAISNNSEMSWNFGDAHEKFSAENADSESSDKNGNNNSNIYEVKSIGEIYDESLSMTSCFQGMPYGPSSGEIEVCDYSPRFNGTPEPSYTVRESPQINTSPSWVELDRATTSAVLSSGYRSYLDPGNLSAWSAPSFAQPTVGITARYPPSTSMPQSIGYPITNAHNVLKRSVNQIPSLDDQHLKTITTNESNYIHNLSVKSSNTSKRRLKSEHEQSDNCKKACYTQTSDEKTVMGPNIVNQKSGLTLSSKPMFVLYINPNLYDYLFSVFGRFPFISYEKNSLASIFTNCYKLRDSMIDHSIISKLTSDTNTIISPQSNGILGNSQSKEMHSNIMCTLPYDPNAMDDLFSYLMATHKHCIKDETSFMSESEIKSVQDMFWDLCQFQEMVNGKMTFIDDDKYYTILETTGIDYDKRKEYILTYINPNEECLIKMVKFFNSLPGFDKFTLADKITLTKSCVEDYYFVSTHRGMDTNKHISIDEETYTAVRFSEIRKLIPKLAESQHEWDDIANELKALRLSLEEIIVIKALVATNPDAEEILEQPDIVKECHKMYHRCLLNLVRKRHGPQADDRFANIVRVLDCSIIKIRKLVKYCREQMAEKVFRMLDQETAPLLKEIVSKTTNQLEEKTMQ